MRLPRAITNGWGDATPLAYFGFPRTHEARRYGQSSKDDIGALIAPILRQIEGGETAPDIRNARTLLAELV